MGPITFSDGKYYLFSNFSAHEVEYEGKKYKTSEHCYQCQKFNDKSIINKVMNTASPYLARKIAHQYVEDQKANWGEIKFEVMYKIILAKAEQHEDVRRILLESDNEDIADVTSFDYLWGIGENKKGRNELGKIWMRVRQVIIK